jgi:hypothetical protein
VRLARAAQLQQELRPRLLRFPLRASVRHLLMFLVVFFFTTELIIMINAAGWVGLTVGLVGLASTFVPTRRPAGHALG